MRTAKNNLPFRTWRQGFTLIELLVVVSIIALLLAVMMPALSKARDRARLVICATRQKTILQGVNLYMTEFNNRQPPSIQGQGWWRDPTVATFWTRPRRLRYYYNSTARTPLNGGDVFATLGNYLRDTSYFACPLSPSYGDAKWQEEYIRQNSEEIQFLNTPYNLLWSYEGFKDDGFNPTQRNRGTLMITDVIFWGSIAVRAAYGMDHWAVAHPFKGGSAMTFYDSGVNLSDEDRMYMAPDRNRPSADLSNVPDTRLNAGYLDGHVEVWSPRTDGIEVGGNYTILPRNW